MGISMKPFDLEKALSGEPVLLRNGMKAVICGRVQDKYKLEDGVKVTFPLLGITLYEDNTVDNQCVMWRDDGRFATGKDGMDVIGMWEEPKLTTEEIMEKAFKEKLVLVHDALQSFCEGYKVVGKTLNNKYILQDLDDGCLQFLHVFNKNLVWSVKNLKLNN